MGRETFNYRKKAWEALKDPQFQKGLQSIQMRIGKATLESYREVEGIEELRRKAKEIRLNAVDNLDEYISTFTQRVRQGGGEVFFAKDSESARSILLELALKHKVKKVVKGKSMVGEEIGINHLLESEGITPIETDLGEFIIQLAGERPSHILGPAIHKSKEQIGRLFQEKLKVPYTNVPEELTTIARNALRDQFFEADMGITGCNLAIASTGQVMLVSNEGNIRFSITIPKVHLVIMGMERIVWSFREALLLLQLLSRAATAQSMATYVSIVGPQEKLSKNGTFYVLILDNGRSRISSDPDFKEILSCIRCGACLNICPVYGKIGGWAYGEVYSGPVGAVLNPLLFGVERYKDLFFGETLCGACKDICPLQIEIPRMLLELRRRYKEGWDKYEIRPKKNLEYFAIKGFEHYSKSPRVYDLITKIIAVFQRYRT